MKIWRKKISIKWKYFKTNIEIVMPVNKNKKEKVLITDNIMNKMLQRKKIQNTTVYIKYNGIRYM